MSFENPKFEESKKEEEMSEEDFEKRSKEAAELLGEYKPTKEEIKEQTEGAWKILTDKKWEEICRTDPEKKVSEEDKQKLLENYELLLKDWDKKFEIPHYAKQLLLEHPSIREKVVALFLENRLPALSEVKERMEKEDDRFQEEKDEDRKNLLGGYEATKAVWDALSFASDLRPREGAATKIVLETASETLVETMREMKGRGCALIEEKLPELIERIGKHLLEAGADSTKTGELLSEAKRMANELGEYDKGRGGTDARGQEYLRKIDKVNKTLNKI